MKIFSSFKMVAVVQIVLSNLIVVTHSQGGGGHHGGGGGHHGGGGWPSNETGEWPEDNEDSFRHDGGNSAGTYFCRDEDDFFNRDTYWTNLTTCDEEFVCVFGHRRHHHQQHDRNDEVNGTFVCRTTFHPITGEPFSRVRCIPTDRAWETDICGCCGDTCPELLNSTSCLDQADTEEDEVVQFALGTSDMETSTQLSSASESPASIVPQGMAFGLVGLGVTMLLLSL
jgi:hypothetical protein